MANRKKTKWYTYFLAVVVVLLVIGGLVFALWFQIYGGDVPEDAIPHTSFRENVAKTVLSLIGGFVILLALWVNYRKSEAMVDSAEAALRNANTAISVQRTEHFTKAIESLGSESLSIRLGGIYSLESLNEDDTQQWRHHRAIVETLAAFVREGPPDIQIDEKRKKPAEAKKPPSDISAALTVLSRMSKPKEKDKRITIDLSRANLEKADLANFELEGARFIRTKLQEANLKKANLINADFSGANLFESVLDDAKLNGAIFATSDLEYPPITVLSGASLRGASLEGAKFAGVDISGADFTAARGITDDLLRSLSKSATTVGTEGDWLEPGEELQDESYHLMVQDSPKSTEEVEEGSSSDDDEG